MSYPTVESYTVGHRGRLQEKQELQVLNDRLSAYVQKVRHSGEQTNQVDSSGFLRSAKVLEEELMNLRNIYDRELENLRQQLEETKRDKNACQVQCSKKTQTIGELQDRLTIETDKNRKLCDEVNVLQRRLSNMESELNDRKAMANQPMEEITRLRQDLENVLRENAEIRTRFEQEQLARQEAEDRAQQMSKKMDFNEQVWSQQVQELRERLEMSAATILSLESRTRDVNKNETSIPELLKQVREASEVELHKYRMESEDSYNRNLHSLKVQMDNDAKVIERLNSENAQLSGQTGELHAKIRNLEGQIRTLEHQKTSLEEIIPKDRSRCLEQVATLEKKLRDLQEILFSKMQEANVVRDSNIPLKAEIEAMKILLEEEERRLQVPVSQQYSMVSSGLAPATQGHVTTVTTATAPIVTSSQGYVPQPAIYQSPFVDSTLGNTYYEPRSSSPPVTSFTDAAYTSVYMDGDEDVPLDIPTTTTRYTYETTPSINKLQIQPSPPETPRPVGPIARAKSAPVSSLRTSQQTQEASPRAASGVPLVPSSLGQGRDYFDQMFRDLQRETLYQAQPRSSPVERPPSSVYHDYTTSTSSAIGDIKILEVHGEGKYIRLVNEGKQDAEFGGFMLQQNVGGHPVAVYRFPPRTKFPSNSTITVWSGSNDPILHQPPSDFVWKEQQKWGSGPECTTILCKPNGQAVAWTTAAHRFTKNAFEDTKSEGEAAEDIAYDNDAFAAAEEESLTELDVNINEPKTEQVYLRREKQPPPTLSPAKHPHGSNPGRETHPHTGQPRPFAYGNDNSSVSRQARSQTTRPDPIPGQPYAGASAQRMGSAPLRKYKDAQGPTIRGSGALANKSEPGQTSAPPSAFMKPHERFQSGLEQLQSQHNMDYLPPMPRPPLFSAW